MKHACDIYKIARQCSVILRPTEEYWPSDHKPRECYCKPTVRMIGQAHGEAHLKTVFMLLTTNERNASVLFASVMTGVSELLVANPRLISRKDLLTEFDAIDIPEVLKLAKTSGLRVPTWHVIATMLHISFLGQERAAA